MTDRQLVVVDCETTNLDPNLGCILEVAAYNMDTNEELYFVPNVTPTMLGNADPVAMQVNRYYERGVFRDMLDLNGTVTAFTRLSNMLSGNTFAGMNPTFDLRFIERACVPSWHYAPSDVGAYVAGAIGMHPAEVPKLEVLTKRFGIDHEPHGALSDVRATVELYRATMRLRGEA